MVKVTEAELEELFELCDEVMDLDESKAGMILKMRADAENDNFSAVKCRRYIEYLKKVVFRMVNQR